MFIILLFASSCQNSANTITDIDGNEYQVIVKGSTQWMAVNLRVKQDREGNPVTFSHPNGNPANEVEFGLLYDYATACKVCPEGWQLPSNEEWETLINMDNTEAANALKSGANWDESANTNTSGFGAKPAGYGNTEHPNQFGLRADFWSSTITSEFRWTYIFEKGKTSVRKAEQHKEYAYSVRCVRGAK